MIELNPMQDRVVVIEIDKDKKTSSGLVILEDAFDQPSKGRVVAVGPGRLSKKDVVIPVSLAIDDVVLYPKKTGEQVKIEGVTYLILKEEQILAKVEEE
jgi:chaperonin GroES